MNKSVLNAIIYAVILNVVLSLVVSNFATPAEINPPNGASSLDFKGQIIHMLVHHGKTLVSSSILIAILVAVAVCFAHKAPLFK
jgi:hypothetical protein